MRARRTLCLRDRELTDSDLIFKQPSRHCEDRSDEAIHSSFARRNGLLRFARNDGFPISNMNTHSRGTRRPSFAKPFRPEKQRAQGMPGAQCTRSLACKIKQAYELVTTVTPVSPGIPRAMVLRLTSRSPR